MTVEVELIQMPFSLILLLQITAAIGQNLYSSVKEGADVTLPCKNVIPNQHQCDSTDWTYHIPPYYLEVVKRGQILKTETDKLRVTANCSLVVKEVKVQDVGVYHCLQLKYGGMRKDTLIYLSVVSINKEEDSQKMRLSCSVSTYGLCRQTVKWLYGDKVMDESDEDFLGSQHYTCFSSVTFKKPKNTELFKCAVEEGATDVHLFPFSPGSSDDRFKTRSDIYFSGNTFTATTSPMTSSTDAKSSTTISGLDWWWYIVVAVVLAGILIITVVLIIRWKKKKGNKRQKNGSVVHLEDGVCYASVSYIKKPKANTQVGVGGDEEDTVTYSVVKASSSSSAAAVTDPSDVYATTET